MTPSPKTIEDTPRLLVFAVRCGKCAKVLAELAGGDYVIKCPRCGSWNARGKVATTREALVVINISIDKR